MAQVKENEMNQEGKNEFIVKCPSCGKMVIATKLSEKPGYPDGEYYCISPHRQCEQSRNYAYTKNQLLLMEG